MHSEQKTCQWQTLCFERHPVNANRDRWKSRVVEAVAEVGTPSYISAWAPVQCAVDRLASIEAPVPIRSWLSFKTHPLPSLAQSWLATGAGVEVFSEHELATVLSLGCPADQMLINGVAKHRWLVRLHLPRL